jgi:NhaP-type Na+/H+ or K+/H+ antiporter
MDDAIVILAIAFLFSLLSRRLQRWQVSAPMVFLAAGVLLGPDVAGLIDADFQEEVVLLIAEAALVIVLFTDAQRIDVTEIGSLPGRLLGLGLPLTIVAGGAVALAMLSGLEVWEAGIIAVLLAPTDSSLGEVVISNRRVPVRIRQALNVEGGLNDGIAVPILFLLLAIGGATQEITGGSAWVEFALKQIGIGAGIGLAAGLGGGLLWREAKRRDWALAEYRQLAVPALALLAFVSADQLGGSGFIAAFAAGLVFGHLDTEPEERDLDFAVDAGQVLSLAVFFVFGAVIVVGAFGDLTWQIGLYAVLSLTLIRMVPVAIAMIGTGLDRVSVAFLGWFGPRGLASIILVLVIIEQEAELGSFDLVVTVIAVTVTLSVFAHGISAGPLSERYGRRAERLDEDAPALEDTHKHAVREPGRRTRAAEEAAGEA